MLSLGRTMRHALVKRISDIISEEQLDADEEQSDAD